MKQIQKIAIGFSIAALLCLFLLPLPGQARLVIESKIISGTITLVQDNAVALDGGSVLYYPASSQIKMKLKPGSVVTLRYYVDKGGDEPVNKYFQYKVGMNSLRNPPPSPVPKEEV